MIVPLLIMATVVSSSPADDKLTCVMERISRDEIGTVPKLWAVVWDDGSAFEETRTQISDPVIGGIRTLDVRRNSMSFDATFTGAGGEARVRYANYRAEVVPSRGRLELTAEYMVGGQGQPLSTVKAFGLCYGTAADEGVQP